MGIYQDVFRACCLALLTDERNTAKATQEMLRVLREAPVFATGEAGATFLLAGWAETHIKPNANPGLSRSLDRDRSLGENKKSRNEMLRERLPTHTLLAWPQFLSQVEDTRPEKLRNMITNSVAEDGPPRPTRSKRHATAPWQQRLKGGNEANGSYIAKKVNAETLGECRGPLVSTSSIEDWYVRQEARAMLQKLSPNELEVATLYYVEGYKLPEIAKLKERQLGTIQSWKFRADQKLGISDS